MRFLLRNHSALLVALVVGTAACSVTSYEQPVNTFAEASRDADTALKALNRSVTDAYTGLLKQRAAGTNAPVEFKPGDCLVKSDSCRLEITLEGQPQLLPPPPVAGNMVALMESIAAYADNLAALVGADTADEVTTHVNAALGSIESLAATIQEANPGGKKPAVNLSEFKTPVGDAVSWLVGQYVASVKIDGLRRATSEAQPVIAGASQVFQKASERAAIAPKEQMANRVQEAFETFQTHRTAANLDALLLSTEQFNQVLTARPADVFQRMNEAHQALANTLQRKDVTLAEASAMIEQYAREARKLAQIAKSFIDLSSKEG